MRPGFDPRAFLNPTIGLQTIQLRMALLNFHLITYFDLNQGLCARLHPRSGLQIPEFEDPASIARINIFIVPIQYSDYNNILYAHIGMAVDCSLGNCLLRCI